MNDGQIPIDMYNKLKTDEYIGDDPKEVNNFDDHYCQIEKYKRRADELLKDLEKVSRE